MVCNKKSEVKVILSTAQEFRMDVPYAIDRLVTYGVPATGKKLSFILVTLHTGEAVAAFLMLLRQNTKYSFAQNS